MKMKIKLDRDGGVGIPHTTRSATILETGSWKSNQADIYNYQLTCWQAYSVLKLDVTAFTTLVIANKPPTLKYLGKISICLLLNK